MKVVKITDGLGNQMFQYAFARKLQMDTGQKVYLDTRFINNEDIAIRQENNCLSSKNGYRKYGLHRFRIKLPCADNSVLRYWNYLSETSVSQRLLYQLSKRRILPWKYCDEDITGILTDTFGSVYYKGYFFDLKYYDTISDTLRKEFVLKDKIHLPAELRKTLQNDHTVGIHVRRGDFLRLNRDISQKGYYERAIRLIGERVENPVYLIFSDDMEWVKGNLHIEGRKIFVSDMGFADYEEMMIMKHCRHNIIANSTFSYWAAYLNQNSDKIVICPRRWKTAIIPDKWIVT